jgi:hypothetical protein
MDADTPEALANCENGRRAHFIEKYINRPVEIKIGMHFLDGLVCRETILVKPLR